MVKWLRNKCYSYDYLSRNLYCNSDCCKWLYGYSYHQCYTKYNPTKCRYHRFYKPFLCHNQCNKNSFWRWDISMVKWLRNQCQCYHYLTRNLYCNSDCCKWLYGYSYHQCHTKYNPTKCKCFWFNKLFVCHNQCNKTS